VKLRIPIVLLSTTLFATYGHAQASCVAAPGDPVIYGACSGPTASSAYVDASVFASQFSNDVCRTVNYVLTLSSYKPGTVVDAKGILGAGPSFR